LAVAKASAIQKGGKEKPSKKQRKAYRISKYRKKKFTIRGLSSLQVLDTFIAQGDEFPHQVLSRNSM
jgi:hypothetical protein